MYLVQSADQFIHTCCDMLDSDISFMTFWWYFSLATQKDIMATVGVSSD